MLRLPQPPVNSVTTLICFNDHSRIRVCGNEHLSSSAIAGEVVSETAFSGINSNIEKIDMLTIAWDDRYLLDLPTIDNQHKYLLHLLNKLYNDFATSGSTDSPDQLLAALIDYATYHFALEERWMEAQQFPLLESHRREHRSFAARVADMERNYREHHRNISLDLLTFLHNWLITHIQGSDHEFGCFIRRKYAELPPCFSGNSQTKTQAEKACMVEK